MRLVVASAGFAGLLAAYRVARAGHEVVVLEARDRVGGRVWSQELVPGEPLTVVERGAEFVLDGYDLMRALADEFGLQLAEMAMSYYEREPRGGAATSYQEMAQCPAVVAGAAASARPGTPLSEVVASWPGSPAALAAYMSRIEVTHGVAARDLGAGGEAPAGGAHLEPVPDPDGRVPSSARRRTAWALFSVVSARIGRWSPRGRPGWPCPASPHGRQRSSR